MKRLALIFVVFLVTEALARDPKQVYEFRKTHACPSTGKLGQGACPDFVVNHVWSLCLGGPDIPENMEWQSKIESYIMDIMERKQCAVKRKLEAKAQSQTCVNCNWREKPLEAK